MYCTNCGTEIAENASFCQHCGEPVKARAKCATGAAAATATATATQNAPHVDMHEEAPTQEIALSGSESESNSNSNSNGQQTAQRSAGIEYFEAARNRDMHAEAAASYQEVADAYKRSLIHCACAGIIIAIIAGSIASGQSGAATLFWVSSGFFFPFGFAPLAHWVNNHGFFILIDWIILIILAVVVFLVAMFACPIYICWAIWKIYSNTQAAQHESELAQGCQEQIATLA